MYNVQNLSVPGAPKLRAYNNGAAGGYRDFWFPVWNSDVDSNETGAPFVGSIPFYIVISSQFLDGIASCWERRRAHVPWTTEWAVLLGYRLPGHWRKLEIA